MEVHKYITQISRDDLAELAALTNLTVGPGIEVSKNADAVKIEVNQSQLRRWMRAFYANGGTTCDIGDIDSISLDLSE